MRSSLAFISLLIGAASTEITPSRPSPVFLRPMADDKELADIAKLVLGELQDDISESQLAKVISIKQILNKTYNPSKAEVQLVSRQTLPWGEESW